ncbi:MAG: UDP-N-acetylglucosamine 2-epimerase (non-hydrolyzing) [Fimbriimonadaceae bacterium]|nr:UDP-N-acetylglucosamine 2-epimerase (non-hydrolyzing) [Fimbriimonadaceae bacterium]
MSRPRIVCVVGTRPDAIKSAPVVLELKKWEAVETVLVATGQHREMLDQALDTFGLKPDHDLAIMKHGQSLAEITTRCLEGLDRLFTQSPPDYVIAQGDTTTTFCSSLAAFYRRIPFGHVEAGLRTPTVDDPFPEEFNRRASGLIATHHFAPTAWAAKNLLNEGKDTATVFVTGNTGIDAVLAVAEREPQTWLSDHPHDVILLTTHRRENWGQPQQRIAEAAREIIDAHPDLRLVVPMHRNPQVRELLQRVLGNHPRVDLIEPPEYPKFVKLMQRSKLILTDSGGVQEEAPAFGIPVLVLRETTERPEGVDVGTARLVGTDKELIIKTANELFSNPEAYDRMARAESPYGDGKAAARVRSVVLSSLRIETEQVKMWA